MKHFDEITLPDRKRPYQRPRILFREAVEAMASTCAGVGGKSDPVNCPTGPIQS